jgi:hypothetical protein
VFEIFWQNQIYKKAAYQIMIKFTTGFNLTVDDVRRRIVFPKIPNLNISLTKLFEAQTQLLRSRVHFLLNQVALG